MAAQTVGQALEEGRPLADAGAGYRLGRRGAHGQHVVAVERGARNAVAIGVDGQSLDHGMCRERRELGVAVVLADEDDRQAPERGDVQRLVEVAGVGRAVTEEDDHHLARAPLLANQRRAEAERQVAADDARGAEQAALGGDQVHVPALAVAVARLAPGQLRHHPTEVGAPGDERTIRTVAGVDVVVVAQGRTGTGGRGFLPDADVDQAGQRLVRHQLGQPLLEDADRPHRAEERPCFVRVQPSSHPARPDAVEPARPLYRVPAQL